MGYEGRLRIFEALMDRRVEYMKRRCMEWTWHLAIACLCIALSDGYGRTLLNTKLAAYVFNV